MKVLFFTQETCGPCRMMKPVIDQFIDLEYIDVYTVKAETEIETFDKYGVQGTPTFIAVDSDGNEVRRKVGAMTKPQFKEFAGAK